MAHTYHNFLPVDNFLGFCHDDTLSPRLFGIKSCYSAAHEL